MTKIKIGVFGCGNMGRALVLGMKAQFPEIQFYLYTPTNLKAQQLSNEVNGTFVRSLSEMPDSLDWYILAFKPQNLDQFQFEFSPKAKIISVLAGVNLSKLETKFNLFKIARLMPNTPAALGLGANLLFLNSSFNQFEKAEIQKLLESTGKCFLMSSEADLNLTTVFSGSGPGLIFELARIFEAELSRLTEGRVNAKEIVTQTFFGSSALMNTKENQVVSFQDLRSQVTSKNGVTYEALEILNQNNLQDIFSKAFVAGIKRVNELSN
jgi:pyrroline-5-carboxylate reductase